MTDWTVNITSTNEPVEEGETLTVDADIFYDGPFSESSTTVRLFIDGVEQDSYETGFISDGQRESTTFQWNTSVGDAGSYTALVEEDNESGSDSTTVDITSSSVDWAVSITDTNSPIDEGQTLTVDYNVSQGSGDTQSTDVVLYIDGTEQDRNSETVGDGPAGNDGTLSWSTSSGDGGSYTATVEVDDDGTTDTASVTVEAPPNFTVNITGTNSSVKEGETLTVDATIENTGDQSDTQTITLSINGSQEDSTSVSLGGGSSTSETFSWSTSSGDAGSYTATVASDDDSDSTTVTVEEEPPDPANFSVSISSTNSPVDEGETLTVDATIENTGDESDTQTITLTVGGSQRDSTSVSLSGGSSTSETLTWSTVLGDDGSYTATISSDDDNTSTSVTVDVVSSGLRIQVDNDATTASDIDAQVNGVTVDIVEGHIYDGTDHQQFWPPS